MGDVATFNDFVVPLVTSASAVKWHRRSNYDRAPLDVHGQKLISLCEATGAQMLNGRILGDLDDAYTFFSHGGAASAIDYFLCNDHELVRYMVVDNLGELSIHCMMSCTFVTG